MIFSKSFGYAIRGIVYIASMENEKRYVQVGEMATALEVPKHFMGKVMKGLAKNGMISSVKGPSGGFKINNQTLKVLLIDIFALTDGMSSFQKCALQLRACNALEPCLMHAQMEKVRNQLMDVLKDTTIEQLMTEDWKVLTENLSMTSNLQFITGNGNTNYEL